jgi:energy-coupling factor transporter ATP-binding protein EcfA2
MSEKASALANTVRRHAQRSGRDTLAERISAEAGRWGEASCALAVVGQVGAGKTQLVNALVGERGLLPTASGGTVVVTVVRATQAPTVDVWNHDTMITVPRDDLARYATRDGLGERALPDRIEVRAIAPRLLDPLVVIDTPGANGPDALAARRAVQAAGIADALLFVVDASSPINAGEVELLLQVAGRVTSLAVVVSKIDRHRGWRAIVADASRAVADRLPDREVTVLGVSSKLAEAAFDPDLDDAEAVELLADSGLSELQEFLAVVIRRIRFVRLRNLLATVSAVVDELVADQRAIVAAGTDESAAEHAAQIERSRRELIELKDDASSWLVSLSDGSARLRDELNSDLQRRLRDYSARCERIISSWTDSSAAFVDLVEDDLQLVAAEFGARLAAGVGDLIDSLAERADLRDLHVVQDAPTLIDAIAPSDVESTRAGNDSIRMKVTGSLVSAATSSSMLLTMAGGVAGPAGLIRIGALGAATVFSGALAAVTVRGDRRNRTRQELRAELKPRLDSVASEGPVRIRSYLLAVQRSLEQQIRKEIRERTSTLESRIASMQSASRTDAAERRRHSARAEDEIRQLLAVRAEARTLDASAALS